MIVEVASDPRELERALDHAEGCIAVAIQDAIRKRPMICANAHCDSARLAQLDKRRKPLTDAIQLSRVLFVTVFADDEFFRICVVAWIDAHLFHPFGRLHRCIGLEMDVGDDRHIAAALAQTLYDVLKIARIFHRRRRNSNNFAARLCQLYGFLDRRLRVHRVAGNHRLHTNRIVAADSDVTHLHLARFTPVITKRINAIVHESLNVRSLDHSRNVLRLMELGSFWRGIVLRVGPAFS